MSDQALQITFTFTTLEEAEQFLAAMRGRVPKPLVAETAVAVSEAQDKPKRGRGRPKKNPEPQTSSDAGDAPPSPATEAAPAEPQPAASNPPPEERAATADDVREALYTLTSTPGKSMEDGLAVLRAFGVQRVPELKPEQYAQAVADCHARAAA